MAKLNWSVKKNADGSIVRRASEGQLLEELRDLQHVDVEWTHANGFPPDYEMRPVTHPPNEKFEKKETGTRQVIKDQLTVSPQVSDSTIAIMLDEKRTKLAKALGVEE